MAVNAKTRAAAELELRRRQERERLAPYFDWYGDECSCGVPLGECKTHHRARPSQRPPGSHRSSVETTDWSVWFVLAGRGFGKTRTGAGWIVDKVRQGARHIALVGDTVKDVRVVMIEGPGGLKSVSPPWLLPADPDEFYQPSKAQCTWRNGATATIYSAEQPDQLRGPQNEFAWCVAEGTAVMGESGYVPVEDLLEGEFVWTRDGLRRVVASRKTSADAQVYRVTTECGESVRLTGNHRVWTENRGWLTCDQLSLGDTILAWKYYKAPRTGSNGKASGGIATARTDTTEIAPELLCTSPSGSDTMAVASPMDSSSITATRTNPTTTSTTSNTRPSASIGANMTSPGPTDIPGVPSRGATSPGSGPIASGLPGNPETFAVRAAAWCFSQRACGRSIAGVPVASATSVKSVEPDGRTAVYDLKVEHCPEFIAGNILVHNCDELAKFKHRQQETWDNLEFGLRLGANPQAIVTTTPRPTATVKMLLSDPKTVVTGGSTYENSAHLAPSFFDRMRQKYEGTRLGRQELHAALLEDTPGALWTLEVLEACRVPRLPPGVSTVRVVVSIDPSAGSIDPESAAECGITAHAMGSDGHGYLLDDASLKGTPKEWGTTAIALYQDLRADLIVAEINNGGDMVEYVLRSIDPTVNFKKLWASRGKQTRAEPVAALFEQTRYHLVGEFPELEAQMNSWVPGEKSPDRLDSAVWGATEIMLEDGSTETAFAVGPRRDRYSLTPH